jgi:hypothetical protein
MAAYRVPGTEDIIAPAGEVKSGTAADGVVLLRPGDAEHDVWLGFVVADVPKSSLAFVRGLYLARGLPSPV